MTLPTVKLTREKLAKYPEYSCSVPTGCAIGKIWSRRCSDGWVLGQYVAERADKDDGRILTIAWTSVILINEDGSIAEEQL